MHTYIPLSYNNKKTKVALSLQTAVVGYSMDAQSMFGGLAGSDGYLTCKFL